MTDNEDRPDERPGEPADVLPDSPVSPAPSEPQSPAEVAESAAPQQPESVADSPTGERRRRVLAAMRRRWRVLTAAAIAVVIVAPTVAAAVLYWSVTLPTPDEMRADQVTMLYAADGSTLDRVVPPQTPSKYVRISAIPAPLRDAVLAAEDRDYYHNPGFSLAAFLRAAWGNVSGNPDAGGGSTITQQYVKNTLVGSHHSLARKTRELLIAAKMARHWSKDDILEAYLNAIYFGRGAYGIADAAEAYFDKPVGQLTLGQDAVLAAVIREPSVLGLDDHRAQLQDRWNYVLDGMVKMGVLTKADRAATTFPDIPGEPAAWQAASSGGPERLIRNQVLAELADDGFSGKALDGLHVTTTIDPRAQQAAVKAAADTLSDQPRDLRAAVVSMTRATARCAPTTAGTAASATTTPGRRCRPAPRSRCSPSTPRCSTAPPPWTPSSAARRCRCTTTRSPTWAVRVAARAASPRSWPQ